MADKNGVVQEKLSYDAWGKRRNINGTAISLSVLNAFKTKFSQKGFTNHKHVDSVGLIHMNGRVYDPITARFLSADPLIQSPSNMQSLNRYSYVMNNPLAYTDPSGYGSLSKNWKKFRKALSELNEERKSVGKELVRAYNWSRDANPVTHYFDKAMMRSKTLRTLGQVVAGVADVMGCSGMCSAAYNAHMAAISGASPGSIFLAGMAGYSQGQMLMGGFGALGKGIGTTINWATGTYMTQQTNQATQKYLTNHTNLSSQDIAFLGAAISIAGTLNAEEIGSGTIDVVGKIWNAPNTAVGLVYGGVGHLAGMALGTDPSISLGNNAIQFLNNPLMASAMTMGNVIVYGSATGPNQPNVHFKNTPKDYVVGLEEGNHTKQGEVLGPLYFPAHIVGGTSSILREPHSDLLHPVDAWHQNNFMETGPMQGSVF